MFTHKSTFLTFPKHHFAKTTSIQMQQISFWYFPIFDLASQDTTDMLCIPKLFSLLSRKPLSMIGNILWKLNTDFI